MINQGLLCKHESLFKQVILYKKYTICLYFWHREQNLNLRDVELSCQPCDPVTGPVGSCQNTAEPMACMNRWSVDSVFAKVKAMLEGKSGPGANS